MRVLLLSVLVVLGAGCDRRGEAEVYVFSPGFTGPVIVVYSQPGGVPAEYAGEARVYRIPADGVLRTQLGPNDGWRPPDVYLRERTGGGRDSLQFWMVSDVVAAPPGDFVHTTSWHSPGEGGEGPMYHTFLVGPPARAASMYKGLERLMQAEQARRAGART